MPVLISEIASAAGVSTATVSRVLNSRGYVSDETRKRVKQAMNELGYSPNLVARSLVTKQSNAIGLMIPHIESPFFSSFASAVEARADELGYNVILCHTREDSQREIKSLNTLANRQVDGIIVTPVGKKWDYIAQCAVQIPIVLAARKNDELPLSSVTADNIGGSYRVIKYLLGQGHRKIAVVNGPLSISSGRDRWLGVKQAFEEYGIALNSSLIKEGDFTAESGYIQAKEIIAGGGDPTAFFAANHVTAIGMLKALREADRRIPEDVSVAAFEGFDNTLFDALVTPHITANIHPTRSMATTAVDLLVEQIQSRKANKDFDHKSVILSTRLVTTDSVRSLVPMGREMGEG